MKPASISELKQELQNLSANEITDICLRLARFKKENKELVSYLLFEAHDQDAYIQNVKKSMDESFKEVNTTNLYFAKKNLRRILRNCNKHIKYAAGKQTEAILLIHYCSLVKASGIPIEKSQALLNIYKNQLKKIKAAIATLHEDIQYDLMKELKKIE